MPFEGSSEPKWRVSKKGEASGPGKIGLLTLESKVAKVSEKEYLFGHCLPLLNTDLLAQAIPTL